MSGWQEHISVGERRCAALLALLVNSRTAVPVADVVSAVPEYSASDDDWPIELDDDVERLRSYGLSIDWEGPGSPAVGMGAASWQTRPVELDADDARLLAEAAELAAPLERAASEAVDALLGGAAPAEADTTISLSPPGSAARGRPVAYSRLHRLSWLASRGATAGFEYRDGGGEFVPRTLQVAGLGESRGVWYAVGLEPGSRTMRAFAVSEMRGPVVDAGGPAYELPPGVDAAEYLAMAWRLGPDPVPARVRFDADIAPFIATMLTHTTLEDTDDGSLEAVLTVGDLDRFVGWVLSFGTHATILEPASAAARAREILESVAVRHE